MVDERPVPQPADPSDVSAGDAAASPVPDPVPPQVDEAPAEAAEKEWWDDPGMPWKHKPTRADIACMSWIAFLGVFSVAMLPLRAWLLGDPERLPWLVGLLASRSGTAALGSVVRVGQDVPFVWPILLGTIMSIKLDWTYWWAGRLWGRGMIDVWAAQSPRASRNYARVERWAAKLGWLGIFLAYLPVPLPLMGVVFVLAGAQGMKLRTFMLLDFAAALLWLIGYFCFGYAIGEPAVALLSLYAKFANYIAVALIVGIIGLSIWRGARSAKTSTP